MDADDNPLYKITHWQKALFLDQVCGTRPRITFTRNEVFPSGESQPDGWYPGSKFENAAFCE